MTFTSAFLSWSLKFNSQLTCVSFLEQLFAKQERLFNPVSMAFTLVRSDAIRSDDNEPLLVWDTNEHYVVILQSIHCIGISERKM